MNPNKASKLTNNAFRTVRMYIWELQYHNFHKRIHSTSSFFAFAETSASGSSPDLFFGARFTKPSSDAWVLSSELATRFPTFFESADADKLKKRQENLIRDGHRTCARIIFFTEHAHAYFWQPFYGFCRLVTSGFFAQPQRRTVRKSTASTFGLFVRTELIFVDKFF